jgi:hypothetical protein
VPDNIPLSEWSGSGATDRLRETIETFNTTATEQTKQMVDLTDSLRTLTRIMIGLVVAQLVVGVIALVLTT